jgi:hypothetical protein
LLIFGDLCKEIFDKTKEFLLYPDVVHALGSFCSFPIHKEITVVGKETGFQDVGEDDVEMLGPSLTLTTVEAADLEKQTYRNAGADEDIRKDGVS